MVYLVPTLTFGLLKVAQWSRQAGDQRPLGGLTWVRVLRILGEKTDSVFGGFSMVVLSLSW